MSKVFRRRGEEGLTLNELLIAMLITGLIMVPLVSILFTTVHSLIGTENRIDESNSAALFASYFGPDIQNAISVATNATETVAACGPTARTVDLLVTTSQPADATQTSVSYYHSGTLFLRRTCSGGSAVNPARVAHNLSGVPTFSCLDSTGATVACSGAWQTVKGSITQSNPATTSAPYTTNVQATKRSS
jgi:Tfp pilus assembly protein PilV